MIVNVSDNKKDIHLSLNAEKTAEFQDLLEKMLKETEQDILRASNDELYVNLNLKRLEILHALEKIVKNKGTYGICEETGDRIPIDRLKVIPYTRYTKRAQELHNEELSNSQMKNKNSHSVEDDDFAHISNIGYDYEQMDYNY